MSDTRPFFSVIVPVYQGQDTIGRALESLISQTFKDFEAIVVNDGSTDGTAAVLSAFARADKRFKVISKSNGGRSSARNSGIERAKGEYLVFLDADDALYPHALQSLCEGVRKTGADVAMGTFSRSFEQAAITQREGSEIKEVTPDDAIRLALSFWDNVDLVPFPEYGRGIVFRSACGKAIRSRLFSDGKIMFANGLKYCEDALFMYESYRAAEIVIALNNCVYHYFVNDSSTTRATSTTEEDLDSLSLLLKNMKRYQSAPGEEFELLCSCFARELITMLGRRPDCTEDRFGELLSDPFLKLILAKVGGVRLSSSVFGCFFNSAVCRLISIGRYKSAMLLCSSARRCRTAFSRVRLLPLHISRS